MFELGLSYSAINTARSSLSAFGIQYDGIAVGYNVTVVRFMKGIHNLRPSKPRYCCTWDVSSVLTFLQTLSPVKFISLKDLTLKLVTLMALVHATRAQSLHLLTLENMIKGSKSYTFFCGGLQKHNRPKMSTNYLEFFMYPIDRRLCVYFVIKEYLIRTLRLRGNCKQLFISYVKPYGPVCKQTISRWIKTALVRSGIDVSKFAAHSIRSASVSKVTQSSSSSVPIETVLKVAGWSRVDTFAKFYKKKVVTDVEKYQSAVCTV